MLLHQLCLSILLQNGCLMKPFLLQEFQGCQKNKQNNTQENEVVFFSLMLCLKL